ncbi:hypothetical protein RHSIM_Rhsim06G0202100 [Rhododendron simsii]|uniref:Uncharacterized protein n=1 Tax=Rhododendron simsii TaxID=118357 RepID=A0A834LNV1_RHOSS|nr:hypothetical protein RHSIM_Rhsim06G0202100 [Rhododendron simsii]
MKVCSFMEPEPLNIAPNIELVLEHEVQRSQENTGREEGEMLEQLKLTKIGSVSVQNLDVQSLLTISSACDTGVREPTISAEVAEKLIEPNADVSVTDTIIAQPTVVQEDIVPLNKQIQCNVEVECQPTFMSSKHKDAVQSVLLQEMDAVPAENMSVISFSSDMIPQILDAEQGTDEQRNIGCEPLLLTEITEVQEKAQDTEVFASAGQEFATGKDPIALRLLVNEVNPELITTCSSELDLMLNKAKLYSESLSRSVTGFSESLTPSAFYELSEDTKKELEAFFRMLEVPLAEIANNYSIAFSESVSRLIAKKVLPLSEHIRLEKFWATLSENLTTAAICQKQMKEKRDSIDQFANVSKDLDTMGNNIEHLKVKLHQIDMEEAELITRLGQLKEERKSLLTEKESINHKLANINYNEQEIEVMVSVARSNFLENQEMYNLIDNKWSYFKRLFMEFKSKIR